MARELEGATRGSIYACDPHQITLVWPKKCKEMGPRDLDLENHPELHPYFAHDITAPLKEDHIEAMMQELPSPSTGRVGVIQPISVAILEPNEEGAYEAMINRPGSWFVACDGRTRTREAREANKRIRASGGGEADIIRVRFEVKKVDGSGALMLRDIAQRCRKVETPLDLAAKAAKYITECIPKPVVLKAMGLKSWHQVENYAALLELDPKLQALVDANQMPMREALKIGRTLKPAEQKTLAVKLEEQIQTKKAEASPGPAEQPVRLSSREVEAASSDCGEHPVVPRIMSPKQIEKWFKYLETQNKPSEAVLAVVAALSTILGTGDMANHPEAAPPSPKRKGKPKRARGGEAEAAAE